MERAVGQWSKVTLHMVLYIIGSIMMSDSFSGSYRGPASMSLMGRGAPRSSKIRISLLRSRSAPGGSQVCKSFDSLMVKFVAKLTTLLPQHGSSVGRASLKGPCLVQLY